MHVIRLRNSFARVARIEISIALNQRYALKVICQNARRYKSGKTASEHHGMTARGLGGGRSLGFRSCIHSNFS
jgi:hypothetical protein